MYKYGGCSLIPNIRLKEARVHRGLSQNDLANLLNLPDARTIGRWERGEFFPHPHYRRELCRVFDMSMEELGLIKPLSSPSELETGSPNGAQKGASTLNVLISYAHEDQHLLEELETHLSVLKRQGYIRIWDDLQILPGETWDETFRQRLRSADIFLFLISSDFLASDYAYDEIQYIIGRYRAGNAAAIPIILRPCAWRETPFGQMQALPRSREPVVTKERDRDVAWLEVADGISTCM